MRYISPAVEGQSRRCSRMVDMSVHQLFASTDPCRFKVPGTLCFVSRIFMGTCIIYCCSSLLKWYPWFEA